MKIKTRFIYLPIALVISTLVIASNLLIANGLPSNIIRSQTADKITVAIRGGGEASGVIIKRIGDTYTILTCAHAVRDLNDNGVIITSDRQEYQFTVKSIKMISGLDLAEISFKSNRSYTIATIGKNRVNKGDTIYVSGWPDSRRERVFAAGKIASTEYRGKDGYDLTYTNTGIRGVSGGPVLNQDAELVGIHGKAENAEVDGFPLYSGIPIDRYPPVSRLIGRQKTSSIPTRNQLPARFNPSRTSRSVTTNNSVEVLKQVRKNTKALIGSSPVMGASDQQIVMLVFSDFQCQFCAIANKSLKEFMAKNKDKVTLVYKYFPLTQVHPEALPAARAAWAANKQGKFWEYHDILFANQTKLSEAFYIETATILELDLNKFDADRKLADNFIVEDFKLGRKLGVDGTPTFIMNGEFVSGAASPADLEKVLAKVKSSELVD